ncbi:MAG: hypothetical protein QM677_07025 [Microbacterium sp.]
MRSVFAALAGRLIGALIVRALVLWRRIGLAVEQWLSPRCPVLDPAIERLAAVRAAVGLVLVVAANVLWERDPQRWLLAWAQSQAAVVVLPFQLAALVVLAAVLLSVFARRGQRRAMLRHTMRPVRIVGIALAVLVAWCAALWALAHVLPLVRVGDGPVATLLALAVAVAGFAAFFVTAAVACYGARAIVRHCFRARDGHPAMRAVVIALLSVWTIAIGLADFADAVARSAIPWWAGLCLLVGGPITNIALSVAEIVRLGDRGVSIRCAVGAPE